jgi:lysophospholipase L1-like esterase
VYIEFESPHIAIIGDSIAEGHPNAHGRLHTSAGTVDLTKENEVGQLSYALTEMLGINVINQGIGSGDTVYVWNRWNRDILGLPISDLGDGIGSNPTISKKPIAVFIHVGINDVARGYSTETITQNYIKMANSCKENNIYCIFNTIMPDSPMGTAQRNQVLEINAWMLENLSNYNATVVDTYKFATNGSESWSLRSDFSAWADTIHPSKNGYQAMAKYMLDNINLPIYLKSLVFESPYCSTMSNLSRAKTITLSSGNYSKQEVLNNSDIQIIKNPICRTYKQRLTASDFYTLSGSGDYFGFTKIKAVLGFKGD